MPKTCCSISSAKFQRDSHKLDPLGGVLVPTLTKELSAGSIIEVEILRLALAEGQSEMQALSGQILTSVLGVAIRLEGLGGV